MLRFKLSILLAILFAGATQAQQSSIKGILKDSSENKNLQNSVISIMRVSDSALVHFTRADAQGRFAIKGIKDSKVIVMVTHPYFGDVFQTIEMPANANAEKDLGTIYMISKTKLLEEVIVRSGSPIRIKGDTTVYTADSFKVRDGANVEELLRRLPNVQIDQSGQITAMGERVKNVLVDGEEFFGSDPGIATKNLRADMVKDVLIYDKKSDQATFTGIDDGVREKTIDLRLKDSKKNGYFGKIEAGGGLKDKYTNSAMLNAFQGKRKIAGYGFMSNTGRTELGFQDAQNYGGGIGETMVMDNGGIAIMISGDDIGQSFSGGRNGIPVNRNAGLHYSNKYNQDKVSLNTGYKMSDINAEGVTTTFSKTFLPDTAWYTNTISKNSSHTLRQALNFTFDATLDSFNSIRWTGRGNKSNGTTRSNYFSETLTEENKDSINNINRTSENKNNTSSFNSTLLWRHRYRKTGRTLSVNTDFNWNDNSTTSQLYSLNRFYRNGLFNYSDTIDQRNVTENEVMGVTTRASYTEPLSKSVFMELTYSLSFNGNKNDRKSFEDDGSGKFQQQVDSLSNDFIFNRIVNTPGISFRVAKKKINYTFGTSVGFSRFIQKNLTTDTKTNYNFTNFFPRANLTYTLKSNRTIRFNYSGSTNAPTLDQLQPIRNNTDRLNNYIGNPNLKQSFNHYVSTGLNFYNPLKQTSFYLNGSLSLTQNAFVQASLIDSNAARTTQTVNTNGIYSIYLSSSYSIAIPNTKWRVGIGPSLNRTQNADFVTDFSTKQLVKNLSRNTGYGGNINIQYNLPNKYSLYFSPNFTINNTKATVSTAANAKYWQLSGYLQGSMNITKTLYFESMMNFQARQKDDRFPANNNFTIWDASIVQRFMKNTLDVKFSMNDILNQNRGYSRNFNSTSFTESYFQTLKRFWLVSVIWNFSKNGKPASF